VLGQIAAFGLLHFLFFGRHFVDGTAILVGDSQISISLNNLATYVMNSCGGILRASTAIPRSPTSLMDGSTT
jgi:hypothetical protein